jgi:hypothetical protein
MKREVNVSIKAKPPQLPVYLCSYMPRAKLEVAFRFPSVMRS